MKNTLLLIFAGVILIITSCKKSEFKGSGSVVFYTTSNSHGKISITVSGAKINSSTFTVPVTSNPDSYCSSGYTGYMRLDVGTYDYSATAADGTKWNGSVDISKENCLQRSLQ